MRIKIKMRIRVALKKAGPGKAYVKVIGHRQFYLFKLYFAYAKIHMQQFIS